MNKKILTILGVVVLVGIIFFMFKGNITGNVIASGVDYQEVIIDMKTGIYSPNTVEVKADVPVRLYLSNNVQGCFRDLTFPELGINKYLAGPKDYLEITFQKGTYIFQCSMNHGSGKIIAN